MVSETEGRNLYSSDQEGKTDGHNVFLPIRLCTTLILCVPCSWRHWSEYQLTCKSLAIYKNLQALCEVSVVFNLEGGRRVAEQELLYSTEEKPPTSGVLIHTFHPQVLEVAKRKSKSRQARIRLIKVIFQITPTIF